MDRAPRQYRRRRARPACDGRRWGRGRGRAQAGDGESSLGARTTTRALVAATSYVAQDLRDPDGVVRPLLRRAALRLAFSSSHPVRRLGGAYLRLDPPDPSELAVRQGSDVIETTASPRALSAAPDGAEPAAGGGPESAAGGGAESVAGGTPAR